MTNSDSTPLCVIGLGQIGGSILRATAATGREVFGYEQSPQFIEQVRRDGYRVYEEWESVMRYAQLSQALIVVAVPLVAMEEIFIKIASSGGSNVITDVGSVKDAIVKLATQCGIGERFVGGHPMAGTSGSGWESADPTLFKGAAWVVSVDDSVTREGFALVAELAWQLGAVVVPARAKEHDQAVARVSHLPHLLAATLAKTGAEAGALALSLGAGSFRDGTRVAGSPVELVEALCENNTEAVIESLDSAIATLEDVRSSLASTHTAGSLIQSGNNARLHYEKLVAERAVMPAIEWASPEWRELLAVGGHQGLIVPPWK